MFTKFKLGSLFDGSGGFPLAGALCGVEPVWAAEIEPYPIAVTRERFDGNPNNPVAKLLRHHFPNLKLYLKHLGDISKVRGDEIEPVDIITFGSPCQDLSVAGKRAGLKHEANGDEETTRSGLFMEAVRIIKEMRKATNGIYPTFAIWENVPGAFSSNSGEDFRIVCEELIKIVEPSASMPSVPQNGWNYADSYVGDGWSLAYRVFDAQYWGVPQRRRRIYLVADFRGERAREILFEREGLRGYFAEGRTPWQTTPADAEGSLGADDREGEGFDGYNGDLTGDKSATLGVNCGVSTGRNGVIERGRQLDDVVPYTLKISSGCEGGGKGALIQEDKRATLATNNDQYLFQPIYSVENHHADSRVNLDESGKAQTLTSRMETGGGNVPMVMEPFVKSARARSEDDATTWKEGKVANTLNTFDQGEARANELVVEGAIPVHDQATRFSGKRGDKADGKGNGLGIGEAGDPMNTLTGGDRHAVAYGLDRASFNQGKNAQFDFSVLEEQQPTLTAKGPGATCANYIVRRLTPTECARLQGFADWWGIVEPKDTLTDEEYRFWLEVRNTHALINGRKVQDYTPKQMLSWYNKLWTDSAEYKMWGNGIALPTALYCVQGVAEALMNADESQRVCMAFREKGHKASGVTHMKEYIDRGALLKELERFPHLQMAGGIVRGMKKADVVEVVRCKDCRCWDEVGTDPVTNYRFGFCRHYQWQDVEGWEKETNGQDFCSYGERKEQE